MDTHMMFLKVRDLGTTTCTCLEDTYMLVLSQGEELGCHGGVAGGHGSHWTAVGGLQERHSDGECSPAKVCNNVQGACEWKALFGHFLGPTLPYGGKVIPPTNPMAALASSGETDGTVYSEQFNDKAIPIKKRDVPIIHQPRQFASRMLYMSNGQGGEHVSE